MFGVTAIAAHSQETVFEAAAFEVFLEFALNIPRQFRALCRQMGQEGRVVFFDKLIKEGPFRAMARVTKRAAARTGYFYAKLQKTIIWNLLEN